MNSAKVSFAINEKEGLAELRRRQDEAGAPSLGLFVKQRLLEELARDDDPIQQIVDALERLRQSDLKTATRVAELSRHIDSQSTTDAAVEELREFRHTLAKMFLAILQENRPLSRDQAEQVVRQLFNGDK